MGVCPNCGNWVDDGDVCGVCGGSGSYSSGEGGYSPPRSPRMDEADGLAREAWKLEGEGRYEEALVLINRSVETYPHSSGNLNTKAIILEDLGRYAEALEYYDKSLALNRHRTVLKNKAYCLMHSVKVKRALGDVTPHDMDVINEALRILPDGEDASEFLYIKARFLEHMGEHFKSRMCYLLASKSYDLVDKVESQLESIKGPGTFINITGTNHYRGFEPFTKGRVVTLVREPENVFDRDAIRVESGGETVGYVANSSYTLLDGVKSASEIKYTDFSKAKVLFVMLDEYVIAKLI